MASISEGFSGECFDFDRLSASRLRGLVLTRKQKAAFSHLLEGKDVLGGSSNWVWKSLVNQSVVLAMEVDESCLVIVPLRSIID